MTCKLICESSSNRYITNTGSVAYIDCELVKANGIRDVDLAVLDFLVDDLFVPAIEKVEELMEIKPSICFVLDYRNFKEPYIIGKSFEFWVADSSEDYNTLTVKKTRTNSLYYFGAYKAFVDRVTEYRLTRLATPKPTQNLQPENFEKHEW